MSTQIKETRPAVEVNKKAATAVGALTKDDGVERILKTYAHSMATYARVRDLMNADFEKGLSKTANKDATVKMLITFVRDLPSGNEHGNYLALDLGGTNFRVLLITLKGKEVEMENKIYAISDELMVGSGVQLFDFVAECLANFIHERHLETQLLPLGFTFSFPCLQQNLGHGRLVQWAKGFKCQGVVGKDVVQLLHEAIQRRGDVQVECVALINDTVGCLMSCAIHDHNTFAGVIIGTGTNACYVEKLDKVQLWEGDRNEPKQVIINTEWGAFGDDGILDFLRTGPDHEIDKASNNPGKHVYEKLISGMYMGELVRRVIVQCAKAGLMFKGHPSQELLTPHRFYSKYVTEIEQDMSDKTAHQVLDELGITNISGDDCRNIRKICLAVSRRAAMLVAAGIATAVERVNRPVITVGMDGSLYRFHPHFHNWILAAVNELTGNKYKVDLKLAEDGSGKGAAVVAAVAYEAKQARLKAAGAVKK